MQVRKEKPHFVHDVQNFLRIQDLQNAAYIHKLHIPYLEKHIRKEKPHFTHDVQNFLRIQELLNAAYIHKLPKIW